MLKLESFMGKWARNVSVESPMTYRSFNIGGGEGSTSLGKIIWFLSQ